MKKLTVKKGGQCMACLQCVDACSTAFYKQFHQDLSCIQIVEKKGEAKPMVCIQCGKCAKVCPQNIDIPAAMADFAKVLEEIPSWEVMCREREEAAKKAKQK